MLLWLSVWVITAGVILYSNWKRRGSGVGLVLTYLIVFFFSHVLAAAIYLLPWYEGQEHAIVELGFKQSAYAILAFAVGSVFIAPRALSWVQSRQSSPPTVLGIVNSRIASQYIVIGLASYFILIPLLNGLPTVTALIFAGWSLVLVGINLKIWSSWKEKRRKAFIVWCLLPILLPILTVINDGFLGFGVSAMIVIFGFVGRFYRPKLRMVILTIILGYLGMSLFVTYMRDRNEIREVVWGGEDFDSRVDRIQQTFGEFEFFDVFNEKHLEFIEVRLNQNYFIGAAIIRLEEGVVSWAEGETLWQALIAIVPRAIWPEKPVFSGSGNLVSYYTGITFADGTAIGVGQVMEAYINFGTLGVCAVFLVIGLSITIIDRVAWEKLSKGDYKGFGGWMLPGIGLLQIGGSFVDVTSTSAGAILLMLVVNRFLLVNSPKEKQSFIVR